MSSNNKDAAIPEVLPLLPVRDMVIYPFMSLALFVGRDSSIKAVDKSLSRQDRLIFLASQVEASEEAPSSNSIYRVGIVAEIRKMKKLSDGRLKILISGVSRAVINDFVSTDPYFEAQIQPVETAEPEQLTPECESLMRSVRDKVEKIIGLGKLLSPDLLLILDDEKKPGLLADRIAGNIGLSVNDSQRILEIIDPVERLYLVDELLSHELEVMKHEIKNRSNEGMSRSQREYFLREQMRAIKNELGETQDQKADELEDLKNKIKDAGMPPKVEEDVTKQLNRLERMHPDSSESSMLRNYLDWMVDIPWSKKTEDNLDVNHAQEVLDADHYELKKVKDRILEFLAVRSLKSEIKGPILCLAGPPGVGKTSLGRSVARAMGREYQRVALGGLKDEAEIRGHRRTYVGAMPGKIIQAMKQAKTKNPVIVLDEIDKLGSDFRGDPSAAMLEVLDPEQNFAFRDNYINHDFDLSEVLFIATANVVENIPAALRDRMEMIHIPGYTENDKLLISKTHLVQRQREQNGLNEDQVTFTDEGIKALISGYTREAGLRNLEREIGSVCRKVAKLIVTKQVEKIKVTENKVYELMGPPRFIKDARIKEDRVGVVTGLAWTQAGGEILYVETLAMKGKGGLTLTGQLGDVMKESATAALSYARAHYDILGIDPDWFENHQVHIHLPAGAIPKDGPSAGVTLATALISLITDTPVRMDLAMTGELTLTGRVLPVGGIREKALAALNQGIKNVIIPIANKKDLEDIPTEFKKKLNFILVDNIDEVLQIALLTKDKDSKGIESPTEKAKSLVA
ncbi:MAG: endopeptidase La [Bdellovibrionaceae bacterium]|nr:endopeptidase La [Pseudobdellovibrionaceae bacterium]